MSKLNSFGRAKLKVRPCRIMDELSKAKRFTQELAMVIFKTKVF